MQERRKAYNGTGVAVMLYPPTPVQRALAARARATLGAAAEQAEDLHVTLAYLGDTTDAALDKGRVLAALHAFREEAAPPARLALTGIGTFDPTDEGTIPLYAAVAKGPDLMQFQAALVRDLEAHGMPVSHEHGPYTPHLTLGYVPAGGTVPAPRVPRASFPAGQLVLGWGGEIIPIALPDVATKPMRSQAQWKYLFASGKPFAEQWANETPGGKGARFRKLPRKKKVVTTKAPNYGARAGQVIAGNLARGGDGKFASAGAQVASAPRPKKVPKRRAKKPARTPEQRQAERAQEQAQNRDRVFRALDLPEDATGALADLAQGVATDDDGGLVQLGLAEQASDGSYRLTPAGRELYNAAGRGDQGMARDTLSAARDRKTAADERATAAQQRQQERAAREQARGAKRADLEKRRQERAAKPAKAGGGKGGGGKGKQPTSAADTEAVARQLEQGFGRIAQLLRGKAAPSFTVFKDARGQYRWFGITSNGYEDRDREIVSTKALAADVARADADGKYGPLRWWHMGEPDPANADAPWGPGLDLGWCDFNAMSDGCLVESGTITHPAIGEALAAKADALGLSPGFFHPPAEPAPDGTFTTIRRFERSLAPHSVVSNPYTRFSAYKEHRMEDAKLKALAALVGVPEDDVRRLVGASVAATHKAAQADGVRFKTAAPDLETIMREEVRAVLKAAGLPPPAAAVEVEKAPAAAEAAELAADVAEEATDAAVEDESFLTDGDVDRIADRVADKLMAALNGITGKVGELDEQMRAYGYARTKTADEDAAAQQRAAALEAQITTLAQQQATAAATLKTAQDQLAELRAEQPNQQPHVASTAASTARPEIAAALKALDGEGGDAPPAGQQSKAAETIGWVNSILYGGPEQQQPPTI